MTLPDEVVADLDARARDAKDPKDRTRTAQVVRCWQKAAERDWVTGGALHADAGVILGAVARIQARWRLPDDVELLGLIERAARRLVALGATLKAGRPG